MNSSINRKDFLKSVALGGVGLGLQRYWSDGEAQEKKIKVGIIGLDTSHAIAFTKALNDPNAPAELAGCQVVAAYPKGSLDIESSVSRIPKYTKQMKEMGIEIVGSVEELLDKVDTVLLETNDGRRHLEQALKVFKAGKPVFIDKPLAASLTDVLAIFDAADSYDVPVFSSSSLRYMKHAQPVRRGKIGTVLGASTYSPAAYEPTHPDLYWYGIHGVEALFTVMKTGCQKVNRIHTDNVDVVVGTWGDGRIGTFRGRRWGKHHYGGTAFGEEGETRLGPYQGYMPLLKDIVTFFRTGESPVPRQETIEIYTFMTAADKARYENKDSVMLKSVLEQARHNMSLNLK